MIIISIAIFLSFALCFIFNGMEMAYLSCNKLKLRHLADEGDKRAQIVLSFYRNPKRYLTMNLLANNLMQVSATALLTYALREQFRISNEWVVLAIIAPLIIIFTETVPKDLFRQRTDDFIYRFSPWMVALDRLFGWIASALVYVMDQLIGLTGSAIKPNLFVTREEFSYVVKESASHGVLHQHEQKMIDTILNLRSNDVEEVMVPLARFPQIPLTCKIKDVKKLAREKKTKAILVYEEIPSIVVGIIYVFDILFEENGELLLSKYLRPPLFIRHDTSSEKALYLLQSKRASYAVVINPYREVVGVASVENLVRV